MYVPLLSATPELHAKRVICRPPRKQDAQQWCTLRERNRQLLQSVEPRWASDATLPSGWAALWRFYKEKQRRKEMVPFFIFSRLKPMPMIGGISLSHIAYGAMDSASIGYWLDAQVHRRGLMTEAVALVVDYAFTSLMLHRINAYCLPNNPASRKLLIRLGFTREGICKDYLRVNGVWRDHELFAITAPEWRYSF